MNVSSPFLNVVPHARCCVICGEKHDVRNCDYVKISKHVPDNPIPSRARLTLPNFLEVQTLTDGSYSIITRSKIDLGTRFGPLQAEKSPNLDTSSTFPLKIFAFDENENFQYLDASDEEKSSWLMYVSPADCLEEQNLICYQEKGEIYYVAIKDIDVGDALKVWYSPYYALKMNKEVLSPKVDVEDSSIDVDVNLLIKKQQKIMERKFWNCKFCSQIENNIVSFARHILKHYTAQHKNMCEICKKTFGSKKHLKNHLKIVHQMCFSASPPKTAKNINSATNTPCKDIALGGPLLNDMFTDSSDLQQSDLNQFELNIDSQNLLLDSDHLTVENLLNENVKDLDHFNFEIDESQKQFVCDICLKQFNKVKLLIVHLKHHTGEFMCYKCLKVFCRKENLKSHICNIMTQHKCNLCSRIFTQKKYLSRHLQAMHNKKFRCASCNKTYYSNKELIEHNCVKIPTAEKEKFMCQFCDKLFYRECYLKKHLKTHLSRVKSPKRVTATCDICGLHLENRNSYYMHRKRHGEPTFPCEICNKRFHRQDTLNEHILIHQDSAQVECSICQKKLKNQKLLNRHMKNHSSSKSFKCSVCNTTFKRSSSLNKHVKNYHNDNKNKKIDLQCYSCPVCNKTIKLRSSVTRHLKKVHANVTNIDLRSLKPKLFVSRGEIKMNKIKSTLFHQSDKSTNKAEERNEAKDAATLQNELDDQINTLLNNAENNLSIQKHAVDSLVEELDMDGKKVQKQAREVCLSIPELTDNYQEITLDKNAYILDNGTIVQPQGDSENVIIYVLDQTYS